MIKIEKVKRRPVYDITVEKNENFYANGILVHNCAEIVQVSSYSKVQSRILKDKELLDKLGLTEFYGMEKVNETSVCNLASIALPRFVNKNKTYNYNKLFEVAYKATINLNRVIDTNFYPSPAAKFSNFCHRPIGLGVQGLADVFFTIGIPYDSDEAKSLNKQIFETIYYAAIKASCDLAKEEGPYASYEGSPISQGKLQFDLWGVEPSDRWDWKKLKEDIAKFGVRNSLTTCVMPTASCVISSTKIQTIEGVKSYQEIMSENGIDWESVEKTNDQRWIQFKNPLYVNTRFGVKTADKIFYNGNVETLEIEMEDGKIFTCSNNHKFLVNRNSEDVWVRADELNEGDDVLVVRIKKITKSGVKPTWDIEVNEVHEYLMENGCVSHNTSSILGNEASYEAQTSNMYLRRVLSGEFILVNKYLVRDLIKNNLWNDSMKNKIVINNGSVLNIPEIPDNLKEIYKTVWEVKQKDVIDMAADRGAFIDQTQSMNIFMEPVNFAKLTNMHFYGWGRRPILMSDNGEPIIPKDENIQVIYDKDGVAKFYRDKRSSLKTGIYYLRIKSAADAVKFTATKEESQAKNIEDINCSLDNSEDCIACSA